MKKYQIIISILMSLLIISCSQGTKKTTAKLKLNLAGITNLGSGIGLGGAILFGKSSTGEQFGKIVSANEQDIDLPNGDWSFYAVMWANTSTANIKDTAYCGKSLQNLNGTAATVSMTLTNASCADADFSAGKHYVDGLSKIHFANFYMEECDELGQSNSFTCLRDNQGSALSYRMVFKSYKKFPGAAVPFFSDEVLYSKCIPASGGTTIFSHGMDINFPSSKSAMPFVVSAEMFLGSTDCGNSVSEIKGVFTHTFQQGLLGESTLENKNVISSGFMCSTGPATKEVCENYFGSWSGSVCSLTENIVASFLPTAECAGSTSPASVKYIKQMVSIPKGYLCRNTSYALTGGDVFPGGDGSVKRPYKICSEWQLNQIGEPYASSSNFSSNSFKLMNDLDMNNADFNVAARPSCVGDGLYKKHHNLNPIGQSSTPGDCSSVATGTSYTGTFNGNNKTISHARINVGVSSVGFVRNLGSNGVIKNLIFKNLQVEGSGFVGGVAGGVNGTNALISNVKIFGGDIDTQGSHAGGVAAQVVNTNKIIDVLVRDLKIHGGSKVGGIVAVNNGTIERSMFRGSINQHDPIDTHVGGLVGEAGTGSIITASLSEGQIDSAAKWTGGIAGVNGGSILNSYSSMYVSSRYGKSGDPSAFVGGIVGGNGAGTIASVYFDGITSYKGQNIVALDSIAAYPSSGTLATCATSSTGLAVTYASCSTKDLRTGAVSDFIGNSAWKYNVVGTLPRLSWEFDKSIRSCLLADNLLSVSAQVAAGRGTYILPVIICNATQLKDINGAPVNRYIKLGDDINIASWTPADLIQTFSGILDGGGNAISSATLTSISNGNTGIFVNNTGTLSNLKIVGNMLSHNYTGAVGILAGVNSGIIRNIYMIGNSLAATSSYVGQVAGSNSVGGMIADVFVREGALTGATYVGGISGSNEGTISHSSVNLSISENSNAYMKFGGITGFNSTTGKVIQSVFSGNMNFSYAISNATATYIGGLVGYNAGSVENAMTKNYTLINVKNANSVGGLVGFNASGAVLKKSISLGKLIYIPGEVPAASTFSQRAGVNAGTMTDTLYLENTSAGYIGQAVSTVCSQTDIDFTTAAPSYLFNAAPLADLIESVNFPFGGDDLRNYMPFTVPTNYMIAYNNNATCANGDSFRFYKKYDPDATGKSIMDLSLPATYSAFDLAYESSTPGQGLNVDRLISFYKSEMYGTIPALTPPIWELDENDDHPRLLQVRD